MNPIIVLLITFEIVAKAFVGDPVLTVSATRSQNKGKQDGVTTRHNPYGEKKEKDFDLNVEYVLSSTSVDTYPENHHSEQEDQMSKLFSYSHHPATQNEQKQGKQTYVYYPRKESFEYKQGSHNFAQRKFAEKIRKRREEMNDDRYHAQRRESEAKRIKGKKNDPEWHKQRLEEKKRYRIKLRQQRERILLGIATEAEKARVLRLRQSDNERKKQRKAKRKANDGLAF